MAKHGTEVEEFLNGRSRGKIVFDIGPHHSGGALRAQRQRFAVAILKGVHLFLDDVGAGADAARKELGELEDGHTYFAEPIELRQTSGRIFHKTPPSDLLGQDVLDAFYALNHPISPK